MALPKAANMYAAVTQRGSVQRLGEVTVLRMDGAGAVAAPTQSFAAVSRWAQSKPSSGILQKDRMAMLDRFEIFVARTGSIVQSRGSPKPLYDLLQSMERIGLDIHDYDIPHSVEELMREEEPEKKPKAESAPENETEEKPEAPLNKEE